MPALPPGTADWFGGIAILDDKCAAQRLHLVAVRRNGDRAPWLAHIIVAAVGTPPPPHHTENHVWRYEEDGGLLHVKPSVRMSYQHHFYDEAGEPTGQEPEWREYFHNDGQWDVRFERWTGDPDDGRAIRLRMHALNSELLGDGLGLGRLIT